MALLKKSSFKFANMLYERINGELHEIAKRPKHVQKLTGSELMNIYRKLIGLIQQKGFNQNGKPFSADDLVGKNQIDWGKDEALQVIILKYPKSQKGQSSILGLSYIKCYLRTHPPIMKSQGEGIVSDIVVSDCFVYNPGRG